MKLGSQKLLLVVVGILLAIPPLLFAVVYGVGPGEIPNRVWSWFHGELGVSAFFFAPAFVWLGCLAVGVGRSLVRPSSVDPRSLRSQLLTLRESAPNVGILATVYFLSRAMGQLDGDSAVSLARSVAPAFTSTIAGIACALGAFALERTLDHQRPLQPGWGSGNAHPANISRHPTTEG